MCKLEIVRNDKKSDWYEVRSSIRLVWFRNKQEIVPVEVICSFQRMHVDGPAGSANSIVSRLQRVSETRTITEPVFPPCVLSAAAVMETLFCCISFFFVRCSFDRPIVDPVQSWVYRLDFSRGTTCIVHAENAPSSTRCWLPDAGFLLICPPVFRVVSLVTNIQS